MKTHLDTAKRHLIVSFIEYWAQRTFLSAKWLSAKLGLPYAKLLRWRRRAQDPTRRSAKQIPRSHWLLPEEVEAIVDYCLCNPGHGYRRLTWMLTDADIVYASPSTVYRVLKSRALLRLQEGEPSSKGKGFQQPNKPHEHWHVDFSYFKIGGVFFYFIGVLDGYSRAILAWDLRVKMEERDASIVLQRAKERYPEAKPRIISDCGSQFRNNEFQRFVTSIEATHVTTSPYYPQSNGKLERFHKTLKEYAYKKLPLDLEDGRRIIGEMVTYYNEERLHSAIHYVTPSQCLAGQREGILAARRRKHQEASQKRARHWKGDLKNAGGDDAMRPTGKAEEARAEERATEEYPAQATDEAEKPERARAGRDNLPTTWPRREPAMPENLPCRPRRLAD